MGEQRRYKAVEGICRRVRGYMGELIRYKGVEGVFRRAYVGGYGDIWENKDDTRK